LTRLLESFLERDLKRQVRDCGLEITSRAEAGRKG
jgi:hypothetical protein